MSLMRNNRPQVWLTHILPKGIVIHEAAFLMSWLMHQSFATKSPSGPGNSGDIDFSHSKAWVYADHCGDTHIIKAQQKAPLKSPQVNANFHVQFGHGIKIPAVPRHCWDNAEVKTLQFSSAMLTLSQTRMGMWLLMTGALYHHVFT